MTEKDIIEAGINYTLKARPVCICGDVFGVDMRQFNRSAAFKAGAKWALAQLKAIDEDCIARLQSEGVEEAAKTRVPKLRGSVYPFNDQSYANGVSDGIEYGYRKAKEAMAG